MRAVIVTIATAAGTLVLAGSAQAIPSPFPTATNWILSGSASLDTPPATPVNESSTLPGSVSAGGRYVAFQSYSDGLLPAGVRAAGVSDGIFVKDRATGAVTLVSRASGADGAPGRDCYEPSISGDGSTVAFTCADRLTSDDTNDVSDVYVRDWRSSAPTTKRVSPAGGGRPSVDYYGGAVAYLTDAPLDSAADKNSGADVYVDDLGAGTQALASRQAFGGPAAGDASAPSINDNGTRVAYTTASRSVQPTTERQVVVARNVTPAGTGIITEVASEADGTTTPASAASYEPRLSGDGEHVAFVTTAKLTSGASNGPDVYERTLDDPAETTRLVSTNTDGVALTLADGADISSNGGHVLYTAGHRAYDRDLSTSTPTLEANGNVTSAALAPDASLTALTVAATPDLDPDIEPASYQVVGVDHGSGRQVGLPFETISRPPGAGAFVNAGLPYAQNVPSGVSADGTKVAISSTGGNIALAPTLGTASVRDTRTGALTIASRADGVDGAVDTRADTAALSADGTHLAWTTSTSLDANDANNTTDVYVRDLTTGRTVLASRAPDGTAAGAYDTAPALDADGGKVVFNSASTALGATHEQVFERDLGAGTTVRVSARDGSATGAGGNSSIGPQSVSDDGTRVLFSGAADDLVPGVNAAAHVFLRDLRTNRTKLVNAGPNGVAEQGFPAAISGDGAMVAYSSIDPAAPGPQGYVRDIDKGTAPQLVTLDPDGKPSVDFGGLTLDPSGKVVAFAAQSTKTGPLRTYRRDLAASTTTVALRDHDGAPLDYVASGPLLTRDGACAVFASTAPNTGATLASSDYAQTYLTALTDKCVPPAPDKPDDDKTGTPPGGGGPSGGGAPSGGGPMVASPSQPAVQDRTAPKLTSVSLTHRRFADTGHRSRRHRPIGTKLRFKLSERATVTYTITRGKHKLGHVTHTKLAAGHHALTFRGRLGRHTLLHHGHYRMAVRATDSAGNHSKTVTLSFEVIR